MFFVRSGIQFRLDALLDVDKALNGTPLLLIGILYFIVRIMGKYAGAWGGCLSVGKKHEVRDYLGLALIPQAGVAIGLAALGARIVGGEKGSILQTIILSSSILYELVGPASAKLGLYLSHSYGEHASHPDGQADQQPEPSLREQMLAIQSRIASRGENEALPSSAVVLQLANSAEAISPDDDEYFVIMDYMRRHASFINRR